ncbi:TPA: replication initiator protein A [Enterococcus faecalis]|uniref:replication initiator protein A n=2 Tax=Enterococcus faecalis TaxID=1351 RepID=UPI00032F60F1|nr:replication initiator protein A [Enterococcus faecalis]EOJ79316.1 replication-associated protein RepA [Enterococcus faecalis EnGen0355]MBJ1692790.1 replication initiator protein A [Enterococcus faecalis]MRI62139.1 replication initiator protein A [Enterococcus faecalis]NST43412.1 replication initiator protein A [Enterococcus faecalis]NST46059.1 replication initiator protein A [Enterococcus faecalis]
MNDFQFISANETYRNLYYQLPKVLFTSEFYKNMSNDSKIAYAMLQDRCEYSIQNNWIDQDGHIYFIFTRNELMDILGCKENKIAKIKKELKDKNLLYEKRIPPKKLPTGEFKNYPNRLYLGKLEVSATDVYAISNASYTNEFPESGKNQPSDKHDKIGVSFESGKNQRPEESNNTNTLFESGKNQPNLYLTNSLDTIDTIDTEKERLQQQLLLDQFSEVQENTFLNKDSLKFIAAFSDTIQEAHEQVGTIIRAKTKVEKEYNLVLIGEDYQEEIDKCLRRVMHKIKTDSTVKSPKGLFYKSFYNLFVECALEKENIKNRDNSKGSEITLHNWLEK